MIIKSWLFIKLCILFQFLIFIKYLIGVLKYFSILSPSLKKSLFYQANPIPSC